MLDSTSRRARRLSIASSSSTATAAEIASAGTSSLVTNQPPPFPCRAPRSPERSSTVSAWRSVGTEIPSSAARSRSVGSRAPARRPARSIPSTRCSIAASNVRVDSIASTKGRDAGAGTAPSIAASGGDAVREQPPEAVGELLHAHLVPEPRVGPVRRREEEEGRLLRVEVGARLAGRDRLLEEGADAPLVAAPLAGEALARGPAQVAPLAQPDRGDVELRLHDLEVGAEREIGRASCRER